MFPGVSSFLNYYSSLLDLKDVPPSYLDRYIATYSLLSTHTCTLPRHNGMWHMPDRMNNLTYDDEMDEFDNCWRGDSTYNHLLAGGTIWYQVLKHDTYQDCLDKYLEYSGGISFKYPPLLRTYFGLE